MQSYELIGPGVTACYAQFRSRNDANRRQAGGDQLRLDYVIERVDGTKATFHPGSRPATDSKIHFYDVGEFIP